MLSSTHDLKPEVKNIANDLKPLAGMTENEDQSKRIESLADQLSLVHLKPEGRRFSPAQYHQAIELGL